MKVRDNFANLELSWNQNNQIEIDTYNKAKKMF